LTVAHLRVSLPLTFSALVPRWLVVSTPRFPLRCVPGLPIAVTLASISLIAVEVPLGRFATVGNWCALGQGRLTVRYGCVVTMLPIITSTACCRPMFTGVLTVIGTAANTALRALAKFQARGLR